MSHWDDRIASHQAFQLLEALPTELDNLPEAPAIEVAESVERLRAVVDHIGSVLASADNQLLTLDLLNALASPLESLRTQVLAFGDGQDPDVLEQAHVYADQALAALGTAIPIRGEVDGEALRQSAESFRRSAGQLVRGLSSEVDDINTKLAENRTELESQVHQLSEKLTAFESQLDAHKQTLDQQIETFKSDFTTQEKERSAAFNASIEEQQTKFQSVVDEQSAQAENTTEAFKGKANDVLDQMDEMKGKAERLLDAIGRTGTEFGFKEYAQEEKGRADLWRWIAVVSLALIVGVGIWVLTTHDEAKVDLSYAILKLLITVPLGALATYAGRQSHAHRENERAARNLHLDIAAIDPYIALLPGTEQEKIKAEMARKIFGHRYVVAPSKKAGRIGITEQVVGPKEDGDPL